MIIGLTGEIGAGKATVAKILKDMNFYSIDFTDLIDEDLKKNKLTINRENVKKVTNDLKQKFGSDILSKKALSKIKDGENYCFFSINNFYEASVLKERSDFILINVIAPEKERLNRLRFRSNRDDPKTLMELRKLSKFENNSNIIGQNLKETTSLAKITLNNDSNVEVLKNKVSKIVRDWLYKLQDSRPDWDHYFMNIAEAVKLRCTCMSAKKGAVIVKDKQIISTGYNGTPRNIVHCNEGGCIRCTSRHLGRLKSGDYSEPCICAHAEENSITQAAYHGVSTKGGTMYTTFTPCSNCAKLIINSGIKRVVAKVEYPDDVGRILLKNAGVDFSLLKD